MRGMMTREQFQRDADWQRERMIRLARKNVNVFIEYVMRDESTGGPIAQTPMHIEWHRVLDDNPNTTIMSFPEGGKAVPLSTEIPTPTGWRTMGSLRDGDIVFSSRGEPTTVVYASPVMRDRVLYRVSFDDGDSVLADADHLWLARYYCDDQSKSKAVREGWRNVTTRQMLDAGVKIGAGRDRYGETHQSRWKIPLASPVCYPERELPIHPYVLGAWLGDGDSNTAALTFHESDRFIYDRCNALDGQPRNGPKYQRGSKTMHGAIGRGGWRGQNSLRGRLYKLGIAGRGAKRIPTEYLTASIEQRRELLAGLIDTDGHITDRSRVEISQVNQALAHDILELVRSLGFKSGMRINDATLNGRVVGKRYRITFLANDPCCLLPRKLSRIALVKKETRARYRYITAIEKVESEPVKCIGVDAPDRSYLMTRSYTVTHNTLQLSVGRTLFELGHDPSLRFLFLSHKQDVMKKVAHLLMQYIESSVELHEVFPDLVPGDQEWGANALTIRRKNKAKDPTVQIASENASPLSARIDRVLGDDIITLESTSSPQARNDTIEWWPSIIGRTTARSRITLLGNAFHPEDLYHYLEKLPGWVTRRYPITLTNPVTGQTVSRWPEVWPMERIEDRAKKMHPKEVKRQLMCEARDDNTAWFARAVIELALRLGEGTELAAALVAVPRGYRTYTGVDLAIKQKDSADTTCLFTIAVDPWGIRKVISIERGRWAGPEIVRRIIDCHRRFQSEIWLEDNAAQDWMRQWVNATEVIPIRGFTTGRNKNHPEYGVVSLATEMQQGRWHIPNHGGLVHHLIQQWIDEMLFYDPAAHTGDALMASWIAREAARKGAIKVGQVSGTDLLRR